MTSAVAGITFLPSIISSSIFAPRRINSGADAMSASNVGVGIMNMDIASGQIFNAAKGVSNMAKTSKYAIATDFESAEKAIKGLADGNKFVNGIGKVLTFTADNINPIICATGAVKVLTADDKVDTAIQEGAALGTMFAFEGAYKKTFGMPYNVKIDNKDIVLKNGDLYKVKNGEEHLIAKNGQYKLMEKDKAVVTREGFYKKSPFLKKQAEAIKDYCETAKVFNKSLKAAPGIIKGLGFACASIAGYKVGENLIGKTLVEAKNGHEKEDIGQKFGKRLAQESTYKKQKENSIEAA